MKNIVLFTLAVIFSGFGSYYGQPFIHENSDAITIIITVITVFAGFLVAIITVLGDPAAMPSGWKAKEMRRESVEFAIIRHNALFMLYLVTIAALFVGALLNKDKSNSVGEIWKIWIDRSYLFLAILSFVMTFALPGSVKKMQMKKLDSEIDRLLRGTDRE